MSVRYLFTLGVCLGRLTGLLLFLRHQAILQARLGVAVLSKVSWKAGRHYSLHKQISSPIQPHTCLSDDHSLRLRSRTHIGYSPRLTLTTTLLACGVEDCLQRYPLTRVVSELPSLSLVLPV